MTAKTDLSDMWPSFVALSVAFGVVLGARALLSDRSAEKTVPSAPVHIIPLETHFGPIALQIPTVAGPLENREYHAVTFDEGVAGYNKIDPREFSTGPYAYNSFALAIRPGSLEKLALSPQFSFSIDVGQREESVITYSPRFLYFSVDGEFGKVPCQMFLGASRKEGQTHERVYEIIEDWNASGSEPAVFYLDSFTGKLSFSTADIGNYRIGVEYVTRKLDNGEVGDAVLTISER